MTVRVAIGEFSRMTYLSAKALRLYHEAGILEPAAVDPVTGYRFYDASQVPVAQVIRRLRDLDMPLAEIKSVVAAAGVEQRNAIILGHLARMRDQLAATQATVASLQALLERPTGTIEVVYRSIPRTSVLAIAEDVTMDEFEQWWPAAFDELYGTLGGQDVPPSAHSGALYSKEFFEHHAGHVIAFLPVDRHVRARGRTALFEVPAAELAIAVHHGSFSELDRTYGALGTYVAERDIGVDGPIREHYAVTATDTADEAQHRTEVCWPVFQTRSTITETKGVES